MPFYDTKYWTAYVNENGIVSFKNPVNKFEDNQPNFPLGPDEEDGSDRIFIAPFWANIDLDNQGYVYYRQSTEQDLLKRAKDEIHIAFVEKMDFLPKYLLIATWVDTGFFGEAGSNHPQNSFQLVLATNEVETFAIFLYDRIEWTTGVESGGDKFNGIGGTPAQVGFNAGDGHRFFPHIYSRNQNNLFRLPTESNVDIIGEWIYHISSRTGVDDGGCTGAGNVKTYPRYDSMLGRSWLYIGGPCFQGDDDIWLRYGTEEDQIALTNCSFLSAQRAYCVTPTFFQVGRVPIFLTRNWGQTYPYTGTFDIVNIDSVPPRTTRLNPDSDSWLKADLPLVIEWDSSLINNTEIRVDILAYQEMNGYPELTEVEELDFVAPNTGRYEWFGRGNTGVTEENAVGVIRITRRFKRDEIALWSDLHILGYLLNEKYQRDPIAWSNIQCEKWYEQRQQEPLYDYEQDLYPCPCNLSQAIADRGRWRPAPFCDINKAGMEDRNDYCRYREDIVHCVINIIHSPQGADSVCCYDKFENLVYAGDSWEGSFTHRVTVNGIYPYRENKKVPTLSSWLHDGIPFFTCCIWGDRCEYYQEFRQTRDCRMYDPPRIATIFGDPHVITFDGLEYTFNGKGEYILMQTLDALTEFELHARFEQVVDYAGNKMPATILTSIAMKEEDLDIIRILHSERTVLEVMVQSEILDLDTQQEIQLDNGVFLTFPTIYEHGNITQVVITFQDSKIGIVVNGTAEDMVIRVFIPKEFKGQVEGLLGNWNDDYKDDLTTSGGTRVDYDSDVNEIYDRFGKSWEIKAEDSLLYYDQGKTHDYYQDNQFVPNFEAPPGNLPPGLTASDVERVCGGNALCEYDVRTTGKLNIGRSTMQAYEDYWFAHKNLVYLTTCRYFPTPKNGTKTFYRERNHNVGSEIEYSCDEDFILLGSNYRICQPNGEWTGDAVINYCVESLICSGVDTIEHAAVDVVRPYSPENMRIRYSCDEGYEMFGPEERRCDVEYEKWRPVRSPGCYRNLSPAEISMTIIGSLLGMVIIVALVSLILFSGFRRDRKKKETKDNKMFEEMTVKGEKTDFIPGVDDVGVQPHVSLREEKYSPRREYKETPSNYAESWA
ncbi:sushi domain-containing protein 2-like isoform X2 [Apostichopus japonicus]